MKASAVIGALGLCATLFAQSSNGLPAAGGQATKMIDMAVMKAMSAIQNGRTVTMTVDNRTVDYTPRVIGGRVYVPIRLFQETGQRVTWNARDMRATLQSNSGAGNKSVDFDAMVSRATNKPSPGLRPVYEKGRVWVPLATGLAAFGHLVDWVPTSNRLNIRTNRAE